MTGHGWEDAPSEYGYEHIPEEPTRTPPQPETSERLAAPSGVFTLEGALCDADAALEVGRVSAVLTGQIRGGRFDGVTISAAVEDCNHLAAELERIAAGLRNGAELVRDTILT